LTDPIHVLLVEDDDLYAEILRSALGAAALKVSLERSTTLADASARLASNGYDAVLLDLNLPDSSGLQTIERMLARAPGTPIVVLTGTDDSESALQAVQHGAQDYLVKSETDGRLASRALRYAIERASTQAELVRRERYFRALIEQAHDIVVVLSPDGTLLYQSPATERVLGYSPVELAGKNVLALMHEDDQAGAAARLDAWPRSSPADDVFQVRLRHKDGGWRVMEVIGRPLDGDPRQGIVVNARDVTERVRAEESLRATEAKLRQVHKMEAVGRLAGGIAHDFNNVLTAIYGYADLLLEEFEPDDPRRIDVEEIRRSAERAAALTRQLLAFSRQQMLQPQVLDLNAVVDEVQRMLSRLVGSDIQTTFEPGPGLWPVRADKGQIAQVLMNLGGNARDAMPEGGSLLIRTANRTISADAAYSLPGLAAGDYVTLTVSDTGIGMPESVRRHIFEPFFTTKEQGQGTGLGLATVYGIVKQSGGGIYVDSEENKGTTFVIYLPPHTPTSSP
jgi:two-component system, cell cycle sensor histidine kinase and response regulator CckA